MTKQVIVALDAGTSVLKAVAFDIEGRPVALESRQNHYVEDGRGGVEQDMEATWDAAAAVIAGLVARLEGAEVVGLAVTGQGDGTWLIDAAGAPVGPALLWLDARAGAIIEDIRADARGRAIFAESGTGPAACQQSGQLLWLRANRPGQLARAATALHCKDWLYFRLTGTRATDPSEGCFTFGSWRSRAYSDTVIDAFGLRPEAGKLPPIVDGVTTHHPLSADAAARLGIPAGTPVVLGYVDVLCSALGAGLYGIDADSGTSIIGSTGMNIRLADDDFERPADAPLSGYRMVFPVPGKTALLQSTLAATLNIDWLVGIAGQALRLAGHEPDSAALLAALDAAVPAAPPAVAVWHPYISAGGERGPFTDARARASLAGIGRGLDLPGMMRGIYEGLALAAADCYAAIGGAPEIISLTGGASRSAAMRQIFAAMLGRKVRIVKEHGSGALGAAMIASVSLGIMPDLATCARAWIAPLLGEPELPDPALMARYEGLLPIYQEARLANAPFWHRFASFGEKFHGG
ncbi:MULTISPECIES: FGGY-family carbohydrate kinase [unclassified Acidiphilium]|uniref:FGGY-family carbohydrate kinase n=1 Tax=unclassified Acidiphilium TaxID=2617493 RepID=UPI00021459A9|nr:MULTISPECIES: FGGY-family carbohydrate kinase [unclassified Acidiphilium]EGO95707.1 Carbohydrate kinase, FGGY [Acidiphilium sp. PM]KDM67227.1 erythritol kinase EryA [Acidiphilium sp. JA12-A1]